MELARSAFFGEGLDLFLKIGPMKEELQKVGGLENSRMSG